MSYTTTSTNNYKNLPPWTSTKSCCIPGSRIIKVYDDEHSKKGTEMTIKKYFESFTEDEIHFIDSFNRRLSAIERKKIIECTNRVYTGQIIRIMFDFEEPLFFECTDEHYIPMEIINDENQEEFYVGRANTLSPWTPIYRLENNKAVKQRHKGIVTYDVQEIEVYNLGLGGPGSFYVDVQTGLIHNF